MNRSGSLETLRSTILQQAGIVPKKGVRSRRGAWRSLIMD